MSKQEEISNALFEQYQKAYNAVKPGQVFPEWFTQDQLKSIEKVMEDREKELVKALNDIKILYMQHPINEYLQPYKEAWENVIKVLDKHK